MAIRCQMVTSFSFLRFSFFVFCLCALIYYNITFHFSPSVINECKSQVLNPPSYYSAKIDEHLGILQPTPAAQYSLNVKFLFGTIEIIYDKSLCKWNGPQCPNLFFSIFLLLDVYVEMK